MSALVIACPEAEWLLRAGGFAKVSRNLNGSLLISVLLTTAGASFANTLPALPSTEYGVVLCVNPTSCQSLADVISGPLVYSDTVTASGAQITLTGRADADLALGDLRAFESYMLPAPTTAFYQANTFARLRYILTISSPLLDGTEGSFVPVYDVTGTTTQFARGSMDIASQDSVGSDPVAHQGPFFAGNKQIVFAPIRFHYGAPFYYSPALAAVTFPSPLSLHETADYTHTASFIGFQLFDSANRPVYAANVSSDVGASPAVLTPEPASIALMSFGFAALALRRSQFRARVRRSGS